MSQLHSLWLLLVPKKFNRVFRFAQFQGCGVATFVSRNGPTGLHTMDMPIEPMVTTEGLGGLVSFHRHPTPTTPLSTHNICNRTPCPRTMPTMRTDPSTAWIHHQGVTSETAGSSETGFAFNDVIAMLIVDTFVYAVLAWYATNVRMVDCCVVLQTVPMLVSVCVSLVRFASALADLVTPHDLWLHPSVQLLYPTPVVFRTSTHVNLMLCPLKPNMASEIPSLTCN